MRQRRLRLAKRLFAVHSAEYFPPFQSKAQAVHCELVVALQRTSTAIAQDHATESLQRYLQHSMSQDANRHESWIRGRVHGAMAKRQLWFMSQLQAEVYVLVECSEHEKYGRFRRRFEGYAQRNEFLFAYRYYRTQESTFVLGGFSSRTNATSKPMASGDSIKLLRKTGLGFAMQWKPGWWDVTDGTCIVSNMESDRILNGWPQAHAVEYDNLVWHCAANPDEALQGFLLEAWTRFPELKTRTLKALEPPPPEQPIQVSPDFPYHH